jgi:hypothetical protein
MEVGIGISELILSFLPSLCDAWCSPLTMKLRGLFEKFVDSPYYSESELCGGAVTVSFSKCPLVKRCISYNAPPTTRRRAADR